MRWRVLICACGLLLTAPVLAIADSLVRFDIAAQPLPAALKAFASQASMQLLYPYEVVDGATANAVIGEFEKRAALEQLLRGTGLQAIYSSDDAATIRRIRKERAAVSSPALTKSAAVAVPLSEAGNGRLRLAQSESESQVSSNAQAPDAQQVEEVPASIPEVLVIGSRILNVDIPRSHDDAQPYVIYDRATIERSGAINVQAFLKQQLPMNTQGAVSTQGGSDNRSLINLRGLGLNQTLILIDGRRAVNTVATNNTPLQPDLNGIPLTAVERIEVLPTTASGIYGGSATGGVINVVLRRDYSGIGAKVTYDNSFDSDTSIRRMDLSAGFSLEGGKTNVLLAGSYADANQLVTHDRDFFQRGQETLLANNPDALLIFGFFPPLGATTNISSADGSPLFGPDTPSFTSVPTGYAGGGGLTPLQTNAGRYNLDLANSAQLFGGGTHGLSAGSSLKSLMATLRREFGSNVQAFLDLSASENTGESVDSGVFPSSYFIPAAAANNPFGKDILVTVPVAAGDGLTTSKSDDRKVVGGVIVRLPKEWSAAADYTWSRSRFESTNSSRGLSGAVAAQIASGSLDVLRDTNEFPIDFSPFLTPPSQLSPFVATSRDAVLRLAGPVGSLPAGAPTLTGVIEHRETVLDKALMALPGFNLTLFFPNRSQSVDSVYLEARVPFASSDARIAGVEDLELQLAARYDEYKVNGSTGVTLSPTDPVERVTNKNSSTNPTVALRYKPISDVTLRASYGTGFLPPAVQQLTQSTFPSSVTDPRRGGEIRAVQVTSGGNPDLLPEESESWSAGIIIAPRMISGLRLSVDWSRITKTDNIVVPFGAPQVAVNNESLIPDLVTREPAPPGDPFGVGPITTVDNSLRNIARAEVEAYDVSIDYRLETANIGSFDFSALMTWQPHSETQLIPSTPVQEKVGISTANPQKFKGNARLTWEYGPWLLGWASTYFDSYALDNSFASFGPAFDFVKSQGATRVPSQIYHDFFSSYRFPSASRDAGFDLLADVEVQLGVRNIFNTKPPLDVSNTVSFYSFLGDPRLASYYLSIQKSF